MILFIYLFIIYKGIASEFVVISAKNKLNRIENNLFEVVHLGAWKSVKWQNAQ
jgi:hypothetical protein